MAGAVRDVLDQAVVAARELDDPLDHLEVLKVTITGTTATAQVKRGKDGPTEAMKFAEENGQWRATSLSG